MNHESPPSAPVARGVTWRSLLVGSALVCVICGLTPYSDYVVANTFLVGSYLPVVWVLAMLFVVICLNAPLHRFAPRHALNTRELAVVLIMSLVSCAIPSQGLLRGWIPSLVAPFYLGQTNDIFWKYFQSLDLPAWLFPVSGMTDGRTDPIVREFYSRTPEGESIPYAAWIGPLLGWGVFVGAWLMTMLALALLTRRQWGVDERLPFPLAQLQSSLIEAPEPGRALNTLFRARAFWIALLTVVVIQSSGPLHMYFSKVVPLLPLSYDLSGVLVEEPFAFLHPSIKQATVFFTFVGVTYFIQARTAFSIWSIWFICQLIVVQQRMMQSDISNAAWRDQHFGACIVYAAGIFWIGRGHWKRIALHAVGRSVRFRAGEAYGYRLAAWALVGGVALMIGWLWWVEVQVWFAALIVAVTLLAHLVTARVVAETGLPYVRAVPHVNQIFMNLPTSALSGRDVYFAGATAMFSSAFTSRESLVVYAQHGMRVQDDLDDNEARAGAHERGKIIGAIVWALVLGLVVGIWASLTSYYTYATALSSFEPTIVNPHGAEILPRGELVGPLTRWNEGRYPPTVHSSGEHFAIGLGVAAVLQGLTWRYTAWPFTPVGYLVSGSQFINQVWFSVMLGWLAKVLILRFGGASMFKAARPLFIGMIVGEALAAGIWALVNLVLANMGLDYFPVRFLPN